MERTQIYLSDEEGRVLDRLARQTGRSKSQLIREAIDSAYLASPHDADTVLRAIRRAAGAWRGRTESGAEYVDRVRTGRLGRLHPPS